MDPTPSPGSSDARSLLYLSLPFLVYLIPLAFGHEWNCLDPRTPRITGMSYEGRLPNTPYTVESYGTGVVAVPFHARVRDYLHDGDLPLWNPYQGLGQPFAAQGEGCPYSPFSILRACFPYAVSNWITVALYYISAAFLYFFMRNLGLSPGPAVLAGVMWGLSGALTLHVARANIADQLAMIPGLFWACERALARRTMVCYGVLALVSALHLLAGFVQIALTPLLLLLPFSWFYLKSRAPGSQTFTLQGTATVAVVIVLGHGLTAFYLLPMAEGMRIFANKNVQGLAFMAMPHLNMVSFFFPHAFGQIFQGWIPGGYPNVVDWNNLFAYSGTALFFLNLMGWRIFRGFPGPQKAMFLFFSVAAALLLLRYLAFPAVTGVNWLPILGRQSSKHVTGPIVFSMVVAAGFVVEHVRALPLRTTRWLIVVALLAAASMVLTAIAHQGGFEALDHRLAWKSIRVSTTVVVVILLVLWAARRGNWLAPDKGSLAGFLGFAVVGELALYLPLGNDSSSFLTARVLLFVLLAAAGLFLALRKFTLAGTGVAVCIGWYAWLVIAPDYGLPNKLDIETSPPYMAWLRQHEGRDFRTFGIAPDYSSLGKIQDIGAVGPLAPPDFYHFVDVAAPDIKAWTRAGSTFWFVAYCDGHLDYKTDAYFKRRPILDWVGLRYLVLDHAFFKKDGRRGDPVSLALLEGEGGPHLRVAYRDDFVTLVESESAQPRAVFSPTATVRKDQKTILLELEKNPAAILGIPLLEEGALDPEAAALLASSADTAAVYPVVISESRPNLVRLRVSAPSAGLVILKDVFCPGWHAICNEAPADIMRVNGFARGVFLPAAGNYEICFSYRPASFVMGIWLAVAVGGFLVLAGLDAALRTSGKIPRWAIAVAIVLSGTVLYFCAAAYAGLTPLRGPPYSTHRN